MKLGPKAMEALKMEVDGTLEPDMDLVVLGAIALEGTKLLVEKEYKILRNYFSEGFLWSAERAREKFAALETVRDENIVCLFQMGEGGVLAALWKMAEASGVGLKVDLRKIPIRQETIEICERFDMDPYKLLSEGAVLAGCKNSTELLEYCLEKQIPAAVIGQTNAENDRMLYSNKIVRFLDRPSKDEITKRMWGEIVLARKTEK